MKKLAASIVVASLLSFSALAMVEKKPSEHVGHAEQTPSESHGEMPGHSEDMMSEMSPEEHQKMPSAPSDEGHGGEHGAGPVIETPPNYKVLGGFAAVNAAFILIGIWNKWFRRKETKTCQA